MNRIILYFFPKQKMSYFDELKSKFLIISVFIGILLVSLLTINAYINRTANFNSTLFSSITLGILLFTTLMLLKSKNFKIAGNVFSLGATVLTCLAISMVSDKVPVLFKFVQGFYSILAFLAINVIFSTRKVLLLNALIIIATTTRVYLYALNNETDYLVFIKTGYVQHLNVVVIITVSVYFANLFTEKVLDRVNAGNQQIKNQNNKLNQLLEIIKGTSEQLVNLSESIKNSTHALTNNTNDHSASLEEISATVEQLTQSIVSNADYSSSTSISVARTREFSNESNRILQHTINAIDLVQDKISIMQDIASRTDMLSINASIEASRAGEFGRGFSVVASEIRKLADKSGNGARDIISLISKTQDISHNAWSSYQNINSDIEIIDSSIQHISAASNEQKISISQINASLSLINHNSQVNAALAANLNESLLKISTLINTMNQQIKNS